MKSLLYIQEIVFFIFALWVVSFLGGCKDETQEKRIIYQAGLLSEAHPDSALALLDSIALPEEMSLGLATEWSMLYARSADKIDEEMPYVSQIQLAVNYYKDKEQWQELAEAYLYLGRSYVKDKAFDKALQAYDNGLTAALQCEDYNRAGYICSYWATLCEDSGEYDQAIEKYELSNSYFQQAGNQKSYVFGLVNEARTYLIEEKNQSALQLVLKADSVAKILNDLEVIVYVYNGLANVYCELKEYDLAEQYVLKGMKLDSTELAADYSLLSDIYYCKGNVEKSLYYIDKSKLLTTDATKLASIDYRYYLLNKEKDSLKNALFYLEQYEIVCDSIDKIKNAVNISEIEKKYNYIRLRTENSNLKRANQNKYILLLIVLSICLFLIVIYLLTIKRKNLYIRKQQQEIYRVSIELQQKKEELRQQVVRMEESKRLLHLQGNLEEEQNKYETLKESVERLNSHLMALKEGQLLQSAVAKKLLKMSQTVKANDSATLITDRYWHTIEELILEVYPTLQGNLKDLTSAEQHICYLTLFKLDTKAMSVLLQINPDSVNKQRFRARQKLALSGKSIDLYAYLITL